MNLHIQKMPNSTCKLIPVASELIPESEIVKTITCNDQVFEVVDSFTFDREEYIPDGFFKIAFGKESFDVDEIWKKYTKSDALVVYVCFPLDQEKQEEKPAEQEKEDKIPNVFS